MAKKRGGDGPNKSEFIRNKLKEDGTATADQIKQAWKSEGLPGELSTALFYQVRSSMGITSTSRRGRKKGKVTKGKPGRKKATAAAAAPAPEAAAAAPAPKKRGRKKGSTAAASSGNHSYLKMEQEIDKLIFQAQDLNDSVLADRLRSARRQLSKKLV